MSEEATEPRRVLVAEDEGLIRLDIVETLSGAGFEIVGEASNGEEAVKLALELEPDLCVMDVKMPKMDGITAAEKIPCGAFVCGCHAHCLQPDRTCRACS